MKALRTALIAIACTAGTAGAVPKGRAARAEFDKGVAAYQKQDYAGASAALGRSYNLEADTETLFAWAQSERQLGNCDKALELYEKLLKRDLPSENAAAVRAKRDECSAIIASQKKPDPEPEKVPEKSSEKTEKSEKSEKTEVRPEISERPERPGGKRAWWKDPIGGALVVAGVGGLAAGTVFLMQGKKAQEKADELNGVDLVRFAEQDERAKSRGTLGLVVGGVGGALVIGGIVRYVVHGGGEQRTQVSGYFDGTGGGLVAFGRW